MEIVFTSLLPRSPYGLEEGRMAGSEDDWDCSCSKIYHKRLDNTSEVSFPSGCLTHFSCAWFVLLCKWREFSHTQSRISVCTSLVVWCFQGFSKDILPLRAYIYFVCVCKKTCVPQFNDVMTKTCGNIVFCCAVWLTGGRWENGWRALAEVAMAILMLRGGAREWTWWSVV